VILSLIVVATAIAAGSVATVPRPHGLTLEDALSLPPAALSERVLGEVGSLYPEVQRPNLDGVPGGVGFSLEFASLPRSAGFPGLCEADTLTVYFWPSGDDRRRDQTMRVQSIYASTTYRIVGDTTPLPGNWSEDYGRRLAALCAHSGPVLWTSVAGASHFVSGRYNGSNDFWAAHAYFAARALQKVTTGARSGALTASSCREDRGEPEAHFCADPRALLATLPLDRLTGFSIDPCEAGQPALCVTASFRREDDPSTHRLLSARIRTTLSEVNGPPPEFEVISVEVQGSTFVN
jgi:hypothetical protein